MGRSTRTGSCRNCWRKTDRVTRGLCLRCYMKLTVRAAYPTEISYRRWDAEAVRKLKDLAAKGLTFGEIADRLGRLEAAVQRKASRLGVRSQGGNVRDEFGRFI